MLRIFKIICLVCIISIFSGVLLTGCCKDSKVVKVDVQNNVLPVDLKNEVIKVDLKDKGLCQAKSIRHVALNQAFTSFQIPPNAGITKIYASITQGQTPIDEGVILIDDTFDFRFSKNTSASVGTYETTFIQPLCVGSEGAILSFQSAYQNSLKVSTALVITVVYCPDFCTEQ